MIKSRTRTRFALWLIFTMTCIFSAFAQKTAPFNRIMADMAEDDPLQRIYLAPQRIVWLSSEERIQQPEVLLEKGNSQAYFGKQPVSKIINKDGKTHGLLLDFGKEIHGGIQITTSQSNSVTRKIRLRFGESVSEAMSEVKPDGDGYGGGQSTNHHSMRDFELTLPGYGTMEVGSTGFRFVRIDLLDQDAELVLKEIRAIATLRDIPYLGSFRSNDNRLNQIWETGAYTVHLNMQQYLWDGIKRDRMVWSGDLHPEIMTISSVFGHHDIVPKSLDFLRDHTPLPKFMNGIPSYSMWWVIMHHDWYLHHGDKAYLKEQKAYLLSLLDLFMGFVDKTGMENLHDVGMRFINWKSYGNEEAIHAGLQAMMVLTFEKGGELCRFLDEQDKADTYQRMAAKMRNYQPAPNNSKEAASLLSLAEVVDAQKANEEVIAVGGPERFSAFFGYYMLLAQAKAGDYNTALDNIRRFWGGMLDLGATTFWEEFDLKEAENAARIDELVPENKKDYHRNTGDHCYVGLRRSLCHGWASGPTPWLTEVVLGIKVLEPGCKKIQIDPHLAGLQWVEGTFPTPFGLLHVKHTRKENGEITSEIKAPDGIEIVK